MENLRPRCSQLKPAPVSFSMHRPDPPARKSQQRHFGWHGNFPRRIGIEIPEIIFSRRVRPDIRPGCFLRHGFLLTTRRIRRKNRPSGNMDQGLPQRRRSARQLFYDISGDAVGGPILFAALAGGPATTNSDFSSSGKIKISDRRMHRACQAARSTTDCARQACPARSQTRPQGRRIAPAWRPLAIPSVFHKRSSQASTLPLPLTSISPRYSKTKWSLSLS